MSDPLDLLISRYLDATASADEVRRLDAQLQRDAGARRALILDAAQHTLLRQCLAEAPPASGAVPLRRPRWVARAVMAAAAALIAALSMMLLSERYPKPQAMGSYLVEGGGAVRRGSVVTAGDDGAGVALGGYCQVDLEPGTTVRIGGAKRSEQVFLEQGGVVCEADRGVGAFDVQTSVGTASVTGTLFAVWTDDEEEDSALFDRRMLVEVLLGAVRVTGDWGERELHAGETAALPPPEAAVQEVLAGLDLPETVRATPEQQLLSPQVIELHAECRTALRRRFFEAGQETLREAVPAAMLAKVRPKVQATRRRLRAGPVTGSDLARIRFAVQRRTRRVMMALIHRTADQLADDAAGDDRLMAWLLAQHVRSKLPSEALTAFDAGLVERGIVDSEPGYVGRAIDAVQAAIDDYDPDITGIIDAKTGAVVVGDEAEGRVSDEVLVNDVRRRIRAALGTSGLSEEALDKLDALVAAHDFRAERMAYCIEIRERLFGAAQSCLRAAMSQGMARKVQAKVMARRAGAGRPLSATERARVQRAVMARARVRMMQVLHDTVDDVARRAAEDPRLMAARVAKELRRQLPSESVGTFDHALRKAGLSDDETQYVLEAQKRMGAAADGHDPDLTGIVDPKTGEIILEDAAGHGARGRGEASRPPVRGERSTEYLPG